MARGLHWPARAYGGDWDAGNSKSNLQIRVIMRYYPGLMFNWNTFEFVFVHDVCLPLVFESLALLFCHFDEVEDAIDRNRLAKRDHRQQQRRRAFPVLEMTIRRHPQPAGSQGTEYVSSR